MEKEISAQLWLDKDENVNFKFHLIHATFEEGREALKKFIALMQSRLDDQKKCPFYKP
jgi:hypothetical protein